MIASSSSSVAVSRPARLHSRSSSSSGQSRPACLLDIFSTPPTARASVDYSVASYSTASTPSLASANSIGESSLSSSLSSLQSFLAAASLPTPPPLNRAMSQPTKQRPSNPPSAFPQTQATTQGPTRCERLLLATLQRAEAAEEAIRHRERSAQQTPPSTPPYPSPRSSTSKDDDDTDWLAEIAQQTCMRPSGRSPADPGRIGRTTSIVHVSRSPSPGKMAKMTRKREQERRAMLQAERERAGEGATFGPMPSGALSRTSSFISTSSSMRKGAWSASPSPASAQHAGWPWEPTSPSSHATATPHMTIPTRKPPISRAQTSPVAPTLRRASAPTSRLNYGTRSNKTTPPPKEPITPPPSPPFDVHSTSLLLKNREGYVSFRDVEGLGAPAEEDEDHDTKEGEKNRTSSLRGWLIPLGWVR